MRLAPHASIRNSSVVRRFWLTAGLIAVAGLILRLIHIFGFHYSPLVDMTTYLAYGELFMQRLFGEEPMRPEVLYLTTRNPPAYPFFLGMMRQIFGEGNIRAPLYLQAFLDAGTILLFALAGRILYGARAGLIAALIYCLYHVAIINSSQLMTETLAMFFCIAAVSAFLAMLERPTWTRALMTGVLLTAAVYFRLNVASLLGVFGIFSLLHVWRVRKSRPREGIVVIQRFAVAGALMITLMICWGIRNSLILNQFVLFTGSNAERFLAGANPVTRGEFTPVEKFPPDWRERLDYPTDTIEARQQRDAAATELGEEFLDTHTAYYYFTIIPTKLKAFLLQEQFTFAGHGAGAPSELPFGPRIRALLLQSMPLVILGLVGLFLSGRRHNGFALLLWALLFLPLLFLPIDPRYRFISELPLVLSASSLLERVLFRHHFAKRFGGAIALIVLISVIWSGLGWARFSGPNLAALPQVLSRWPAAQALVHHEFEIVGKPKAPPTRLDMLQVPVDPGEISHVEVRFDLKALPATERDSKFKAWSKDWPEFRMYVDFYDDSGSTVPKSMAFPNGPVGSYFHEKRPIWNVVEIPGLAKQMKLSVFVTGPGAVMISDLEIRGPVWAP